MDPLMDPSKCPTSEPPKSTPSRHSQYLTTALLEVRTLIKGHPDNQPVAHILRKVAEKYSISFDSLKKAFQRKRDVPDSELKNDERMVLSTVQEYMLLGFIKGVTNAGSSPYIANVITLISMLFEKTVDHSWVVRFLSRFRSVFATTAGKKMEEERKGETIVQVTDSFVTGFGAYLDKMGILNKAKHLITCDETLLTLSESMLLLTRIKDADTKAEPTPKLGARYGSMLPFVSADGTFWLCAICVATANQPAAGFHVVEWPKNSRTANSPLQTLLFFSPSGYFSQEQYAGAVRQLLETLKNHGFSTAVKFLLADNLAIHRTPELVLECAKQQLHLCALAPNCTRFMAPLDNQVFGCFKTVMTHEASQLRFWKCFSGKNILPEKAIIPATIAHALEKSFTKEIIKNSFANTGIMPWNPELIRKEAASYAPTKTPTAVNLADHFQQEMIARSCELAAKAKNVQIDARSNVAYFKPQEDAEKSGSKRKTPSSEYVANNMATPEFLLEKALETEEGDQPDTPTTKKPRSSTVTSKK